MCTCTSLRTYVHARMFVTVGVYIFARLHAYACICMVARVGMCAHVRAYVVCVCVHVYIHVCTCASICACMCACACVFMSAFVGVCANQMCVCACGCADIYAHVRVHVCLRARART